MRFPGDTSLGAPPGEIINCRCTLHAVYEREGLQSDTIYDEPDAGTLEWLRRQDEDFQIEYWGGRAKRKLGEEGHITLEDIKKPVKEIVTEISPVKEQNIANRINKHYNNKKGDDINMEKQELTNIIKSVLDEAIKPLNDKLDAIEKQNTPTPEPEVAAPTEPAVEAAELAAAIKSAISEAIKPVENRLMVIEKSKGVSRQAFDDIAKSATNKSVFAGLNF